MQLGHESGSSPNCELTGKAVAVGCCFGPGPGRPGSDNRTASEHVGMNAVAERAVAGSGIDSDSAAGTGEAGCVAGPKKG